MSEVCITCFKCKTACSVPGDTSVTSCPNCHATGRWFKCTGCDNKVNVWSARDTGTWTFTCPHCGRKQGTKVAPTAERYRNRRMFAVLALCATAGVLVWLAVTIGWWLVPILGVFLGVISGIAAPRRPRSATQRSFFVFWWN